MTNADFWMFFVYTLGLLAAGAWAGLMIGYVWGWKGREQQLARQLGEPLPHPMRYTPADGRCRCAEPVTLQKLSDPTVRCAKCGFILYEDNDA